MSNEAIKILGVRVDKVNPAEAYNRFLQLMDIEALSMIFTPNTEIVMMAQQDKALKAILREADLVVPDGIGLVYASKLHKLGLEDRVPGIELMDRILKYCHTTKRSIYILGGKPGVAERATEAILKEYPCIESKGFQDGYFKPEQELKIIDRINELKPDILFVAMGAPKQEKWIYKHRKILNVKIAMGVGGSADVWAGTAKRAPAFYQKMNLEWLYRLLKNPSRIGRMMALPKFMLTVMLSRDFSKAYTPKQEEPKTSLNGVHREVYEQADQEKSASRR
ncbi:WecB/TagA/CpsF family glycosyltransferase [Acidaminobacter hydrogenoformans]|uniref:N-acetylglucosaminyldiphosphoundecaprenol N-acetyl-beta-D-mannosaminyltransferase n=1 Tax=Acidaminobacter hydrogenoformans DSM 2784 TaxID=1120920 RepID=A0A1G5S4V2_9FIRM|nr:WecB/TagA/CpsF family glycosyltransferase [Acidaminobacter hydrogenoformans]SCZ80781.1 N-acetylmannosaminyltransferase [Acidaminobacter hydrogenoformans DSM 2784]